MALFGFVKKKKEEKEAPACCCGGACQTNNALKTENACCCENVSGISSIKVLGAGCKNCHAQYENVKQAAEAMGLSIEVEYITDMPKVMEYGVMSMPAIVVNEKVVSQGKVLKADDVEALLHKLGF